MPLPFLIGGFASIRGGKNKKGSVKEAVKRHNGNLEKLRIKENDCSEAINDLEMKKIKALSSLSGIVERVRAVSNRPKLDYISFSNVKLQGFDEEALLKAAEDPQWFLSSRCNDEGSYLLENKAALTISEDADKAWEEMEQVQEKIYSEFLYYDRLQNLAEQYACCVENVRDLYEKHLKVLDQFKAKTGKTDWNLYNETEKFATQNAVQLAVLLYELCSAELIVPDKDKPDTALNAKFFRFKSVVKGSDQTETFVVLDHLLQDFLNVKVIFYKHGVYLIHFLLSSLGRFSIRVKLGLCETYISPPAFSTV